MTGIRYGLTATALGLASSVSIIAMAQAQGVIGNLAKNDSIMIDGRTFSIIGGRAVGDASPDAKKLGARELGPGAIIFRLDDKLYIADPSTRVSAYLSDAEIEREALGYREITDAEIARQKGMRRSEVDRQGPQGLRAEVDADRQRPQGLRDTDVDRQRPLGYRDLTDAEIARQKGMRRAEVDRQGPQGLRAEVDADRQRPQGLRDTDADRQRPLGYREITDAEIARQKGMRRADVERQRTQGLREGDAYTTASDNERQRPLGLSDLDVERERLLNMGDGGSPRLRVYIDDPDYAYYRLKKMFEETWVTDAK